MAEIDVMTERHESAELPEFLQLMGTSADPCELQPEPLVRSWRLKKRIEPAIDDAIEEGVEACMLSDQ